jgi:hypothetical protein
MRENLGIRSSAEKSDDDVHSHLGSKTWRITRSIGSTNLISKGAGATFIDASFCLIFLKVMLLKSFTTRKSLSPIVEK